jgi:hypothetical protein
VSASVTAPPPIPLEPGEVVLLAGGRSWQVWLYSIVLLPMLCMLMPFALVPWAVTGRYWLTQRRLIWKPALGKPKVAPLAQIEGVDVVVKRATVGVRGPFGRFTLRFVADVHRLWGALVLFRQLPLPEAVGVPRRVVRSAPTLRVEGRSMQQGVAVAHQGRVVFLPKEGRRDTRVEAAKLAGFLALTLVGVRFVTHRAELPFDLWLRSWSHLPDDEFTQVLGDAARRLGGEVVAQQVLEPVAGKHVYRHGAVELRAQAALLG